VREFKVNPARPPVFAEKSSPRTEQRSIMSTDAHPSSRDQDSDRQHQARVARAAAIRDHILRSRRTLPALAIFGAVAALQGCIAVGGSPRQEAPTMTNHDQS
jgi:hypothetical protein